VSSRADDLSEALHLLRVGSADERLSAARLLREWATPSDVDQLRRARRRELDHYVRIAIDDALAAASSRQARVARRRSPITEPIAPPDALETATATVLHEIRPVLGLARLAAGRGDLETTTARLDQMHRTLAALEDIARRGDATGRETFDLGELIHGVVLDCDVPADVHIEVHPGSPLPVHGRAGAVSVIVRNGLVNALEAVSEADLPPGIPVTISYGCTDRQAWVSVMDDGDGVPADVQPFDRGATRKSDHDGVGLTLARRAADSLGGVLTLTNLADRGAQLRLEWPQPSEPT
jgi:signal transduction histidine kinase